MHITFLLMVEKICSAWTGQKRGYISLNLQEQFVLSLTVRWCSPCWTLNYTLQYSSLLHCPYVKRAHNSNVSMDKYYRECLNIQQVCFTESLLNVVQFHFEKDVQSHTRKHIIWLFLLSALLQQFTVFPLNFISPPKALILHDMQTAYKYLVVHHASWSVLLLVTTIAYA